MFLFSPKFQRSVHLSFHLENNYLNAKYELENILHSQNQAVFCNSQTHFFRILWKLTETNLSTESTCCGEHLVEQVLFQTSCFVSTPLWVLDKLKVTKEAKTKLFQMGLNSLEQVVSESKQFEVLESVRSLQRSL